MCEVKCRPSGPPPSCNSSISSSNQHDRSNSSSRSVPSRLPWLKRPLQERPHRRHRHALSRRLRPRLARFRRPLLRWMLSLSVCSFIMWRGLLIYVFFRAALNADTPVERSVPESDQQDQVAAVPDALPAAVPLSPSRAAAAAATPVPRPSATAAATATSARPAGVDRHRRLSDCPRRLNACPCRCHCCCRFVS